MESLKYFKISEFNCKCCNRLGHLMSINLLMKLDRIRHQVQQPIVIHSGVRCWNYNEKVNGEMASAHLTGLAVDIEVTDNKTRFKIIEASMDFKINRIGVFRNHIHLDIDSSKPKNVIWYSADRLTDDFEF